MTQKAPIQSFVPGALPVELVDYYDEFSWYYPACEPETKHWFVKNVRPDWVIFDVGANVGVYSVLFSRLADEGHVTAFEPTQTVEMLRANLEHNECTNVQVQTLALGSKTGVIEDGIYRIWGSEPERASYPFSRLDDYVRNNAITRLDCIKIDVDSFDFEVLLGARETIRTLKPIIVVELNHALSRRNQSNIQALEWLREQGIEEALSLDGDNFVIVPGGKPSDTYPVSNSLRIIFADTRELPTNEEEAPYKVLVDVDPYSAGILHGGALAKTTETGAVEVTTDKAQWSYAMELPLALGLESDPNLRVLADIEVLSGRVGVGCLGKDGQYLGPERQVAPGARRVLLLPITDPASLASLTLRNVRADGESSVFLIHKVHVARLEDEAAPESEITVAEMADRVREAEASQGGQGAAETPQSTGSIDVVGYDELAGALGFETPFVKSPGGGDGALSLWKMERDDAPIFRYVYRNLKPRRHLEFGTWEGFGVVACAESCDAEIWTLNLPDGERDEDGASLYARDMGDGATRTDAGEFIGRLYRQAGFEHRVHQILEDSTQWDTSALSAGHFDSALIDGGHTYEVVVSDTDKTIPLVRPGGIVMWHDFCPDEEALQTNVAPQGVVKAVALNHHRWAPHFSRLFWIRPSWVLVGIRR